MLIALAASLAFACSAGGAAGVPVAGSPATPGGVQAQAGSGQVSVSWNGVAGASGYTLYWSPNPGVTPGNGTAIAGATSPYLHGGLQNGTAYYYVVTAFNANGEGGASSQVFATPQSASPSTYDPSWAAIAPQATIVLDRDPGKTDTQNGAILKTAMQALQPGQRLEVGGGQWSISSYVSIDLAGTAQAPIWIASKSGETAVITRPDAGQNVLNVGAGGATRFLSMERLVITGGSTGMRLYNCRDVRIDRCHIHHVADNGITANSLDTARLWLTRNEIDHTGGTAEGMYLGANNSVVVMRDSVIALNHVHDTFGSQGDGIEVKQGSYGNWIVENVVHDTNYPCILVYGTDGNAPNVVERNVCWSSGDNVMQVQGEAIVRNNLLMDGARGFSSHDHQGQSRDLVFVHNTIVNSGRGAHMSSWNGRPGMVFANNVVYSQFDSSIFFSGGSGGVDVAGNVVLGGVSGAASGWVVGNGLGDFTDVAWNASRRDAVPAAGSAILATGDMVWAEPEDLTGATRVMPLDAGCYDGP